MNRQQRRALAKNGNAEQIVSGAIHQTFNKIKNDTVEETVVNTLAILFLVLHDKFGFGKDRLNRIQDSMNIYGDAIYKGEITLDEIMDELKKIGVSSEKRDKNGEKRAAVTA